MRFGLRTRYAMTLLAVVVAVSAAMSMVVLVICERTANELTATSTDVMRERLEEQAVLRGRSLVETLAQTLVTPVYYLDMQAIGEVLGAVQSQGDVEYAYVLGRDGALLHDGSDEGAMIGQRLPGPEAERAAVSDVVLVQRMGKVLDVAGPVLLAEGHRLGVVRIGISTLPLTSQVTALASDLEQIGHDAQMTRLHTVLSVALILCAVGAVIAFLLGRRLAAPIRRLVTTAERIGQGDFDVRAPTGRKDEIGDLELALARMSENIRDSENRLHAEQEAASEAARVAESGSQAKSEFLANMSHEIRTPLHAILGATELMTRTGTGETRHAELVATSARDVLAIVDDLLDLARIEAGRLTLRPADFDLGELLDSLRAQLAPRAGEKGLVLVVSADQACRRPYHGDRGRLRQVLTNLLDNAIKFTESGRVDLDVRCAPGRDGDDLVFAVRDTGPGIAAESQARMFEAFERLDEHTGPQVAGTGLGLAISRRLVELQGGQLDVDSAPGHGSTFTIRLRLNHSRRVDTPVLGDGEFPVLNARVLVAEDSPVNQRLVQEMLELMGSQVELAPDGRQAYERITAGHHFDVVLMDCQLPRMNGYEAATAIREWEAEHTERGHVPIIAVTAHAMADESDRCRDAGMDAYVAKPFRVEDIHRAILATLATPPESRSGLH